MCTFKPNLWIVLCVSILPYSSQAQEQGISCFRCVVTPIRPTDVDILCSHFDGSAKFQIFCPFSTFCMKKTIKYKTKTSESMTVVRDCASQKYTFQIYNENEARWNKKDQIIEDAYSEGCFVGAHRGSPTNPPEYCFCTFHLCNSSPKQTGMFGNIYSTILVLLIIRLL